MTVLFALFVGCATHHIETPPGYIAPGGPTVATINDQAITQAVIDAEMSQLPAELLAQLEMTGQLPEMTEQILIKEALYQAALSGGVLDDADLQVQLAIHARDAMIEHHLRQVAAQRTTDERIAQFYNDHIETFQSPQASASHILLSTEEDAQAVLAELEAGARFEDLAKLRSLDPTAAENDGDLGWFGRDQMVPEFEAAVYGANTGSTVGPVESQFGWHIIHVHGFRDVIPLEEISEDLREFVEEEVIGDYIEELQVAIASGTAAEEVAEEAPAEEAPAEEAPTEEAPAEEAAEDVTTEEAATEEAAAEETE